MTERINYQGRLEGIISSGHSRGPKAGIEEMMELDQFKSLLDDEVSKRGLVKGQVSKCICKACHIFSEAANGNNGHLILRYGDHSDNQIAELFVL